MQRLTIQIAQPAFDSLAELARLDRRPVRDEAGWMLERCIEPRAESISDLAQEEDGHALRRISA